MVFAQLFPYRTLLGTADGRILQSKRMEIEYPVECFEGPHHKRGCPEKVPNKEPGQATPRLLCSRTRIGLRRYTPRSSSGQRRPTIAAKTGAPTRRAARPFQLNRWSQACTPSPRTPRHAFGLMGSSTGIGYRVSGE